MVTHFTDFRDVLRVLNYVFVSSLQSEIKCWWNFLTADITNNVCVYVCICMCGCVCVHGVCVSVGACVGAYVRACSVRACLCVNLPNSLG